MRLLKSMEHVSKLAAPLFAVVFVSSAIAVGSPSSEQIDLHNVGGLDASLPGVGDSSGFAPLAASAPGNSYVAPNIVPNDSGSVVVPNPVPLPWSGGLGAVGLATLAMRRRRRTKLA